MNGRFTSDSKSNLTFQNRQGTSLIDIVAVHFSCFDLVKDFRVGQFTHLSDYAPIFLSLRIHTSIIYSEKIALALKRTYVTLNGIIDISEYSPSDSDVP